MSPRIITRRDLLRTGLAGAAAAAVPANAHAIPPVDPADSPSTPSAVVAAEAHTPEGFQTLSASEGATLEAITARLIPSDANTYFWP